MAGAGYKLFVSGDVLTAAQVNTYLNEQTVMVFATSAARTSALSLVLAEGMMSYLQDSNTVFYYDGAAWNALASGDITAITAGNGISVTSGTGPVPTVAIDTTVTVDKTTAQTLTNKTLTSPALTTPTISTLTTNGDLVYGTGSGALSRLGIGSSAQVLTVTGGVPTWAAAAGGGKVLQVISATSSTETNNSTTTQTDSTLTLSITPTAVTSRVLIMVYTPIGKSSGNANNGLYLRIMRGATEILLTNVVLYTGTALTSLGTFATQIVDSPATTSATTYKLQFANNNAGASVTVQQNGAIGTIIAMEIGA